MADNKIAVKPHDASRIDIRDEDEIDYWREHFGISRDKLLQTVERVGPSVKDVEAALRGW